MTREVLGLFLTQAGHFAVAIRGLPPNSSALVHTLKGSARAIGAWPVAETAEILEALLASKADAGPAVSALVAEIVVARKVIEKHLGNA